MEYKNRNPEIILLSGKAKSGKNRAAFYIKECLHEKKVIEISYSHSLKNYVQNITDWNGKEETKPRDFLQEFGISFLKEKIDKHFLINRVLDDIRVYSYFFDVILVTDVRLQEEIEIPRKTFENVIVIRIQSEKENGLTEKQKKHITETDLDLYQDFDYSLIYQNDDQLKNDIKKLMEEIYGKENNCSCRNVW